ncbi:MAG TPA: hypothetical protein VH374_00185 [Polyangia bacterium]|nr:hypothetical protein [Polyangia bacterium]
MGMVVAFVTAGVVFGIGQLILPQPEWAREVPQPPATIGPSAQQTPPSPPPPPAPVAAATTTPPAGAIPPAPAAAPPSTPPDRAAAPTPPAAPEADPPAAAEAARRPAAERSRGTDKEIARAAWRKNLPDVTADANRASILIPIRGSTAGSAYHLQDNPKAVLITLPKAESMISMEFYKIRHDGFLNLWIKHDDAQGTTLKVVLGDASGPQVEIQDDFVRVTVQKTAPAASSGN